MSSIVKSYGGLSTIRSIQRGVISVASTGALSGVGDDRWIDVTITAIEPSKAIVLLGTITNSSLSTGGFMGLYIESATKIRLRGDLNQSAVFNQRFEYQVVEHH